MNQLVVTNQIFFVGVPKESFVPFCAHILFVTDAPRKQIRKL